MEKLKAAAAGAEKLPNPGPRLVKKERPKHLAPDGFLRPGLKLIGGKQGISTESIRKLIYATIPDGTEVYLEPFIGGSSVLVGKQRHSVEMINDINPWSINFFKLIQSYPDLLWKALKTKIDNLSESSFFESRSNLILSNAPIGKLDLAAAVDYYIVNKLSNNGIVRFNLSGACNSTFCKTVEGRGIFTEDWFFLLADRWRDVEIFNQDYKDFLVENLVGCDPTKTLIYLDPPYYQVETKYYIEWKQEDHFRLNFVLKTLASHGYSWMLSYNDCPEIRVMYKDFQINEVQTNWCCSNTAAGRGKKQELIISHL